MKLAMRLDVLALVGATGIFFTGSFQEIPQCAPYPGSGTGLAQPFWVEVDGEVAQRYNNMVTMQSGVIRHAWENPGGDVRGFGEVRARWQTHAGSDCDPLDVPDEPADTTTTPDPDPDPPPEDTTTVPEEPTSHGPGPRTGWPTAPVAPDSLTFDYLQADRGVVVWWWGGDATGWVLRGGSNTTGTVWKPMLVQRGVTGHSVFIEGIGGGDMHLDGPGSHWTCIDAWYDPTQPEHDYTDPEQEPVDRLIPDTLAAGAMKVTRCNSFPYPNPDMPVPSYDYRVEWPNGTLTRGQEPMQPSTLIAGEAVRFYLHRIDSCGWALPDSPDGCPGQPLPDSVVFVVGGQRAREQVHPYTFPGGSDDPLIVPDSGPVTLEWQVFGDGAASGALEFPVRTP